MQSLTKRYKGFCIWTYFNEDVFKEPIKCYIFPNSQFILKFWFNFIFPSNKKYKYISPYLHHQKKISKEDLCTFHNWVKWFLILITKGTFYIYEHAFLHNIYNFKLKAGFKSFRNWLKICKWFWQINTSEGISLNSNSKKSWNYLFLFPPLWNHFWYS